MRGYVGREEGRSLMWEIRRIGWVEIGSVECGLDCRTRLGLGSLLVSEHFKRWITLLSILDWA